MARLWAHLGTSLPLHLCLRLRPRDPTVAVRYPSSLLEQVAAPRSKRIWVVAKFVNCLALTPKEEVAKLQWAKVGLEAAKRAGVH